MALYKFFVVLIKHLFRLPNINYVFIHLLAGFIAGGIIWGDKSMIYIIVLLFCYHYWIIIII